MSFYFESIGSVAAVKAALVADTDLPASLKAAILEMVNDKVTTTYAGVSPGLMVKATGHAGNDSHVHEFFVKRINLAAEPPTISPEAAAQIEFGAGANLALEGRPLSDDASDSAKEGYASVNSTKPAPVPAVIEAPATAGLAQTEMAPNVPVPADPVPDPTPADAVPAAAPAVEPDPVVP